MCICNNDCKRKSDTAGPKHSLEIKHACSSADFQDTGNQMNDLHEIRTKNANPLIIGQLNINSLRNKLEMLEEIIKDKIDIFLISETKLKSSFPSGKSGKFFSKWENVGGSLLYVREDIPCKILNEYTPEKPK